MNDSQNGAKQESVERSRNPHVTGNESLMTWHHPRHDGWAEPGGVSTVSEEESGASQETSSKTNISGTFPPPRLSHIS